MSQIASSNNSGSSGADGSGKLVVVALVLAVVAVVLVNLYIVYVQQASQPDEITVYKLQYPVSAGDKLRDDMVRPVQINVDYREGLGDPLTREMIDNRMGQAFVRSADQGQFLTSSLFDTRDLRRLDREIPSGKRGIALPVNSREVPASLREGAFVDLAATFSVPGAGRQTMPVMENVQVKAIGNITVLDETDGPRGGSRRSFRRIEIDVSPQDALYLAAVNDIRVGDYKILVRNPADKSFELIPQGGINPNVLELLQLPITDED